MRRDEEKEKLILFYTGVDKVYKYEGELLEVTEFLVRFLDYKSGDTLLLPLDKVQMKVSR